MCSDPISGSGTGTKGCTSGACGVTCNAATVTQCATPNGTACVNKVADPQHCGSCGKSCGNGGKCAGSACSTDACALGATTCGLSGCVDTNTAPGHCGGCNKGCLGSNNRCENGACKSAGSAGLTACGNALAGFACVDLKTNPEHCGSCGSACTAGKLLPLRFRLLGVRQRQRHAGLLHRARQHRVPTRGHDLPLSSKAESVRKPSAERRERRPGEATVCPGLPAVPLGVGPDRG